MKILVCGGRDYADYHRVCEVMRELTKHLNSNDIFIIAGKAKGADTLAVEWAKDIGSTFKEYPADWKNHGKSAGYIRNKQMLREGKPDLVVAFTGGKGTNNMIALAEEAGIEVIKIDQ